MNVINFTIKAYIAVSSFFVYLNTPIYISLSRKKNKIFARNKKTISFHLSRIQNILNLAKLYFNLAIFGEALILWIEVTLEI